MILHRNLLDFQTFNHRQFKIKYEYEGEKIVSKDKDFRDLL